MALQEPVLPSPIQPGSLSALRQVQSALDALGLADTNADVSTTGTAAALRLGLRQEDVLCGLWDRDWPRHDPVVTLRLGRGLQVEPKLAGRVQREIHEATPAICVAQVGAVLDAVG